MIIYGVVEVGSAAKPHKVVGLQNKPFLFCSYREAASHLDSIIVRSEMIYDIVEFESFRTCDCCGSQHVQVYSTVEGNNVQYTSTCLDCNVEHETQEPELIAYVKNTYLGKCK
jgi:hypothetical protein